MEIGQRLTNCLNSDLKTENIDTLGIQMKYNHFPKNRNKNGLIPVGFHLSPIVGTQSAHKPTSSGTSCVGCLQSGADAATSEKLMITSIFDEAIGS